MDSITYIKLSIDNISYTLVIFLNRIQFNYKSFKGNIIKKTICHTYGLNDQTVHSVDLSVQCCLLQLNEDNFLTHCKHTIKIKPLADQCFNIKQFDIALN